MTRQLKDYQIKAIQELQETFDFHFNRGRNKRIVFKAPTGSGKTFMMTKLIEKLALENENTKMCFIWASIGKGQLHRQSYHSVKNELNGYPDCQLLVSSYVSSHEAIDNKQVLFVNWESLIQKDRGRDTWKNSLMRNQETRNFLDLVTETKKRDIKIILIVDESHIGEDGSTQTKIFRNEIIEPTITIEMSATPKVLSKNEIDVEVLLEDAIEEGMIKESLIINKDISLNSADGTDDSDSIKLILSKAYLKREELTKEYKWQGSKVNPLVLIQIPNTDLGDDAIVVIKDFLQTKNITYENGKLAIWLQGEKNFDSEKIKRLDNEIEYLIFKTVIDTGWDCPRAQILVKLRDVKSETSKIQTIGRILRTPEGKKYLVEKLDNGYIYTNMEYIDPRNDVYTVSRIKDLRANIKPGLDKSLPGIKSFYKSRQSSYNAADSRIAPIIEEEFNIAFGIKPGDLWNNKKLEEVGVKIEGIEKSSIINETSTTTSDLLTEERIGGGIFNINVLSSEIEIRGRYEEIISSQLNGLARVRSLSPIKQAIAKWCQSNLEGITRSNALEFSQNLIVKNADIFSPILSKCTVRFKSEFPDANTLGKYSDNDFEIADEKAFSGQTYVEMRSILSLYDVMFVPKDGTSDLEQRFLDKLDQTYQEKIDWVWHNGSEPTIDNFGVMKEIDGHAFRPDFIIKFLDGRIGIFDTKGINYMVDDTKSKAIALQEYIKKTKMLNPLVFGGIIIHSNNIFYLNSEIEYFDYSIKPSDWKNISLIF